MTTLPPESNGEQPQAPAQPDAPAHWNAEAPAQPAAPEAPAAPAQPEAPAYTAPPADAYQAPPAAPPAGGYQQPAPAAAADPVSNITLNYWLSVFFTWIPALIFWIIGKDKGNARATAFHVANFNFSLLRTGVVIVIWIFGMIPAIGWLLALLLWLASVVLFVFHIMAAVKAPEAYKNNGPTDNFIFNLPIIK